VRNVVSSANELVLDALGHAARAHLGMLSSFYVLSIKFTACIVSLQNPHILPFPFVNP